MSVDLLARRPVTPPPFLYSREQYAVAVEAFHDGGQPAPQCLSVKLASRRHPDRYERVAAAWPTMSLEDKVTHLASVVGYYVRGTADDARHVITYGYEMLCRRNTLSNR